jgi:hypothetical protein
LKIYNSKDKDGKDKINVKDFGRDDDTGGRRLRAGLINPGLPDVTYNDLYLVSMFTAIKEVQNAISHIDGTSDFRPYMLTKLAVCMVADRGVRQQLLGDLDDIYRKTLKSVSVDPNAEEYLYEPEKLGRDGQKRISSFFWSLTLAILPILGEIISYLNSSMNIAQQNQIGEC